MSGIATVGSSASGTCYGHKSPLAVTGEISSGSGNVMVDGKGVARVGDLVTFECGHTGNISGGSGKSTVNGEGLARVGDPISGTVIGVITAGSGTGSAG